MTHKRKWSDIDWIGKFSSRKFWAGVTGFVTSLLVAFNAVETDIARVLTVLGGIQSLCIYMLAEAKADSVEHRISLADLEEYFQSRE